MRVLIATGDVIAAASIKVTLAKANLTCDATALGRKTLGFPTAAYGATSPLPRAPATVPSQSGLQTFTIVQCKPVC
jgi:hypothetical protein